MMQVRFWGTRGSVPSPGPHTVRYGGNTPCVEVRSPAGGVLVLDAGTGIRELGRALVAQAGSAPIEVDVFLTHLHWDHVQGLPFFAPLYRTGDRLRVWGPDTPEAPLPRVIRALIAPPTFPVSVDEAGAAIEFAAPPATPVRVGGCEIAAFPVRHPGGAVAYRVGAVGGRGGLVYVSDNEVRDVPGTAPAEAWRADFLRFASGARVLVHDSTYTAEEYQRRNGWGHSTYADAVELAHEAAAERLVLFHHNPDRTDDELDRRLEECRALAAQRRAPLDVVAAAEGMVMDV